MVVVLTYLRGVGGALVLASGQRQGCFTNAGTVDPLQRQAYAHYQQVER